MVNLLPPLARVQKGMIVCAIVACATMACAATSSASGPVSRKHCSAADVEWSGGVAEIQTRELSAPRISVSPLQKRRNSVVLFGPELGSMDAREVRWSLRCSADALDIDAFITRGEGFDGSALKNSFWQPVIRLAVLPKSARLTLRATWHILDTHGVELTRAQTPTLPERRYPLKLEAVVRE